MTDKGKGSGPRYSDIDHRNRPTEHDEDGRRVELIHADGHHCDGRSAAVLNEAEVGIDPRPRGQRDDWRVLRVEQHWSETIRGLETQTARRHARTP
jgi:hypothetical protein